VLESCFCAFLGRLGSVSVLRLDLPRQLFYFSFLIFFPPYFPPEFLLILEQSALKGGLDGRLKHFEFDVLHAYNIAQDKELPVHGPKV
jgi:hypothetical protein